MKDHHLIVRSYRPADTAGVLRVLAESMTADPISEARFTRQVLLDPNFRTGGALVAERDGSIIGFCLALARQVPLENAPGDGDRGYITLLGVAPSARRRGVGASLLSAAEEYLRSQDRSTIMVSSYAPGYFIPGVDIRAYAAGLSFFLEHEYREVYRPLAMQTSLWEWEPTQWVQQRSIALGEEGVRFTNFSPELTLPLLQFTSDEFPGDWVRVIREGIGQILQGDSPARLIVAIDNETIVGFSHYENERFGPIGVAASQRGRGLGQVLMFRTLQEQREAGFRAAWFLWSDDKTATRLYNAAGFKEVRRFALLRKDLG